MVPASSFARSLELIASSLSEAMSSVPARATSRSESSALADRHDTRASKLREQGLQRRAVE